MNRLENHILTVDLEDWLQSSWVFYRDNPYLKDRTQPTERVLINAGRLANILNDCGVKATWFVLGSVAERFPRLLLELKRHGHEIGSHGFEHNLVYNLSVPAFRQDVRRAVRLLEDKTGDKVKGYRAPYFSINQHSVWALDILAEEGLEYDSSVFPIRRRLYGFPGAPKIPFRHPSGLYEIPISTFSIGGRSLPLGGGGYFRILPFFVFQREFAKIEKAGNPVVFYMHPYEIDDQEWRTPLPGETLRGRMVRYRQGFGRSTFEQGLKRLLARFKFTTASEWIEKNLQQSKRS